MPGGPIGLTWPQYDSGCGWTCGSTYVSEMLASRKRLHFSLASPRAYSVPREPDLHRLDRQLEVVDRTRGAGEVQHLVDRPGDVCVLRDVALDQTAPVVLHQVLDVGRGVGQEVVQREDLGPVTQQLLAQVRAQEASTPGHQSGRRRAHEAPTCAQVAVDDDWRRLMIERVPGVVRPRRRRDSGSGLPDERACPRHDVPCPPGGLISGRPASARRRRRAWGSPPRCPSPTGRSPVTRRRR
jgi:hypothetical protein